MGRRNEGSRMQVSNPFSRPANQDRKHFPLGTSTAVPAAGYFADVAGLSNEQVIRDAIAGLSSEQEIEATLVNLLGYHSLAHDYMRWRLRMKK
jgi:hypothetical protein